MRRRYVLIVEYDIQSSAVDGFAAAAAAGGGWLPGINHPTRLRCPYIVNSRQSAEKRAHHMFLFSFFVLFLAAPQVKYTSSRLSMLIYIHDDDDDDGDDCRKILRQYQEYMDATINNNKPRKK